MTEVAGAPATSRSALISEGLGRVLELAQQLLVERPGLTDATDPRFARLDGQIRGLPVTMYSRRFAGGGYESVVLAEILDPGGQRLSATVIGAPARGRLRPALGVDLVAMGGALALVALDLAPLDPEVWSRYAEPVMLELRAAADGRLTFRKRPAFCDNGLSPHALIAGAREGQEGLAFELACRLLRSAAALPEVSGSQGRVDAAWRQNLAWRAAERDNRKQTDALGRIFGESIARSYIETFLFPVEA